MALFGPGLRDDFHCLYFVRQLFYSIIIMSFLTGLAFWPIAQRSARRSLGEDIRRSALVGETQTPIVAWFKSLAIAVSFVLSATYGAADNKLTLAAGDTVLFSIVGSPEFDRNATIGPDGMLQVPLAGSIAAQGKSLPELQREISDAIVTKPFRITDATGEESWRRISASELIIDVASYRPVYVIGDVRNGGEYTFLPGMTVRQAVALAGGLGAPASFPASELQVLSLASRRDALVGDIEAARGTLERLDLDLRNVSLADDKDAGSAEGVPSGPPLENDLDQIAKAWLDARAVQRAIATSNTEVRLAKLRNRLKILRELEQSQLQALEIETEELERAETLVERGIAPAASVSEARRVVLQISMQVLETSGEISRMELDVARTEDEFGLEQSKEKIDLLTELGSERANLDRLVRELAGVEQTLMLLGAGSLLRPEETNYVYEVHRQGRAASLKLNEMTSHLLRPGDVLQVTAVVIEASTSEDF